MKRFVILLTTIFMCSISHAETFNQYWYNEDNTLYSQTTCSTGGDITLPTHPTKYGYDFIGWEKLPIKRIEYLESTGTQYIDTGVYPNSNFAYELKFSGYTIPTSDRENVMFGETSNSWTELIGINQSKNKGRINVIPYMRYDGVSCSLDQQTSGTFLLNNTGLYYNDNLVYSKAR